MNRRFARASCLLLALHVCRAVFAESAENWSQWRGPLGTGAAKLAKPPTTWSETENIRWKTRIPGKGHSSPVVWEDQIILTTAIPIGEKLEPKFSGRPGAHDNLPVTSRHQFVALSISRKSGKILWQKTLAELLPHEGAHYTASLASASPVTDGQNIIAFFGSHGLFCLDMAGKEIWAKDLGDMHTKHGHGEGSSPALFGNTLVINWDHEEDSFVVAFDKRTGEEIWRKEREEVTSWSSPIVAEVVNAVGKAEPQCIVCGTDRVRGYELATGKVIWECSGMSANIVATPIYSDGMLYVGSSYEKRILLALNIASARGDISATGRVVWSRIRGTPYVPSPLLTNGSLYFLTHYQAIFSRVDAKTGRDTPGAFRLQRIRNIYASPVAADGRIYITGLDGYTCVVSDTDEPKLLSVNRLNDSFSASAAIVGSDLLLRGAETLYCLGDK